MSRKFVGYHGTTTGQAVEILRTGYFKFTESEEAWLGKGIYFYEEYIANAHNFCVKIRNYRDWKIIKCNLEGNSIIDLQHPEHFKCFESLAKQIRHRYMKKKDGQPRQLLNFVVMNMMYDTEPYDIARNIFEEPTEYTIYRTNVRIYPIILCVRNRDCIKDLEEANCSGF